MTIDQLIQNILSYNPNADVDLIKKAYHYAEVGHEGQKRNSGEPYIIHPLHVAMILSELKMDDATICAGLLHDILEDTEVSYEKMVEDFGEEITILVDGVTKLKQIQEKSKFENQVDNYRKMVMAMANDIRVIIIKLADRLHNLRTLDYKERNKQIEKARETLEIYVPIAHRLGIYKIKSELEDLCLKFLEPEAYYEIANLVNKKLTEREDYIQQIIVELGEKLEDFNITYDISGRPKSLYSIYKKMYQQNKAFDQIFDMTAIRVLVDSVKDCYSVLGIVHTLWKPIPKRFKDYIAMPKPNMYQSLHTTVIGPKGETFEVQIRTWEMHQTAEYGIAAHWNYKEGKSKKTEFDEKLTWIRQLMEWQQNTTDSDEYLETLKGDFFSGEVYVFSPNGDVINLPRGSTPIDFAYRIHSGVGNSCVGAKVDGRLVPLDHILENGNIIEILTSKNSTGPSRDWLKIAKSNQAKTKIKQFFKHAKRSENIESGRELIERDLKKDGYRTSEVMKEEWLENICERMSFSSLDDMFAAVGYGSTSISSISTKLKELFREYKIKLKEEKLLSTGGKDEGKVKARLYTQKLNDEAVRVKGEGIENLEIKYAQCCSPVQGDQIVGFITKGRGISIHRKNCVNIVNTNAPERLIEVEWALDSGSKFYATIQVLAVDRSGYLASLAELISKMEINVASLNAKPNEDQTSRLMVTVEVNNSDELNDLMTRINRMPETIDVYRMKN